MIIADYVAIGIIAVGIIIGLIAGFGKVFKFFTSGVFGVIICLVLCYFFGGLILKWSFTQALLGKLIAWLGDKLVGVSNFFNNTLSILGININLGQFLAMILFYILLFIILQILRAIVVSLIKGIFEANNVIIKFINKLLGAIILCALLIVLVLLAFQIVYLVGDPTATTFQGYLKGSVLRLDYIYASNPLAKIFEMVKGLI